MHGRTWQAECSKRFKQRKCHLCVGGPRGNQNREPSEIKSMNHRFPTTNKIVLNNYVSSYALSRSKSMTMLVAQLGKTSRETHWPADQQKTQLSNKFLLPKTIKKCGMPSRNLGMDPRLRVVRETGTVLSSILAAFIIQHYACCHD